MSTDAVQQFVQQYRPAIDTAIFAELERRSAEVREISPHLEPILAAMTELAHGGKRLRGLLTLLGYELLGGTVNPEVVHAAAVMELFHLGLLIQDDVMDRDGLRRNVVTIHHRYDDLHLGESIAMCAGDLTFGWGMQNLAGLNLPMDSVTNALKVWGTYFGRVGYGQILDVIGEQRGDTGPEEVLQVLQLKSGEYTCVLPLLLGATLGGANDKLLERLKKYGMELGWVFQLRDDWLAEYGDTSKTGKPVGTDKREGRKSYATLYGKAATEKAIKAHWEQGKVIANDLSGDSRKVLDGLLEWMAAREN